MISKAGWGFEGHQLRGTILKTIMKPTNYGLPSRHNRYTKTQIAVVVAVVGLAIFLAFIFISGVIADKSCPGSLYYLGTALREYHDVHHSFPPAYMTDHEDVPVHSWRITLLPYMAGEKELATQYRYDEPWNGPHNSSLHGATVGYTNLYHCGKDPSPVTHTSYVAVVGPNTAFPGARSVKLSDMTRGATNTAMLVETHSSGIHWMEPRDLAFGDAIKGVNAMPTPSISSLHTGISKADGGGAFVLFAGGNVGWFDSKTDAKVLRQWIEIEHAEKEK